MHKLLLLFLFLPLLYSCNGEKVPIIGINDSGEEVAEYISEKGFSSSTSEIMNKVAQDSLDVLADHKEKPGWEMNHFQVGLLINTSIGPVIWKASATPGFRLVFKKK